MRGYSTVSPSHCCIGLWNNYPQNCSPKPNLKQAGNFSDVSPQLTHTHTHSQFTTACLCAIYHSDSECVLRRDYTHWIFLIVKTP